MHASGAGWLSDLWRYNRVSGLWMWVAGASTASQSGVYGVRGTPSPSVFPGAREGASAWVDTLGSLVLFGGNGFAASGSFGTRTRARAAFVQPSSRRACWQREGLLNDVWRFNITSGEWVWIKGATSAGQPGSYGTLNTAATSNSPGARRDACATYGAAGRLVFFGGNGVGGNGVSGTLARAAALRSTRLNARRSRR